MCAMSNKFKQNVSAHSTCLLGPIEESLTEDCTCEIKIGSTLCKSFSCWGNSFENISFVHDCGTCGESKCCFEKDNLIMCTLFQDSNGQRLCSHTNFSCADK